MDFRNQLSLSYYQNIATLNEAHQVYLVKHRETGKIYVKKILTRYNLSIYRAIRSPVFRRSLNCMRKIIFLP